MIDRGWSLIIYCYIKKTNWKKGELKDWEWESCWGSPLRIFFFRFDPLFFLVFKCRSVSCGLQKEKGKFDDPESAWLRYWGIRGFVFGLQFGYGFGAELYCFFFGIRVPDD